MKEKQESRGECESNRRVKEQQQESTFDERDAEDAEFGELVDGVVAELHAVGEQLAELEAVEDLRVGGAASVQCSAPSEQRAASSER